MGRYDPLTRYLALRTSSEAPLSFREVERILNRDLPASARLHQPWWANTKSHSHAESWLRVGWKTRSVDLAGQSVVFVRDRSPLSTAAAANNDLAKPKSRPSGGGAVTLRMDDLSPLAAALVRGHASERGLSLTAAIGDLLEEAAMARRGRMLDEIIANAPTIAGPGIDTTTLIREDRDAR